MFPRWNPRCRFVSWPLVLGAFCALLGCGKNDNETLDIKKTPLGAATGSRDTLVHVSVSADKILAEVENRTPPEERKSPKFQIGTGMMKELGLSKVDLYVVLLNGEALPALIAHDPSQKTFNALADNPLFQQYLEKSGGDALKLKPGARKKGFPDFVSEVRIRSIGSNLIASTPAVIKKFEDGSWDPAKSEVTKLAEQVQDNRTLGVVSILPRELAAAEREVLNNDASGKGMGIELASGILQELNEPFQNTTGMAIGFSFAEDDQRRLRYVQSFSSDKSAQAAEAWLSVPPSENPDLDDLLDGVQMALAHPALKKSVDRDGSRLDVTLTWSEDDDEDVSSQLRDATFGFVFNKEIERSTQTSQGPIVTRYVNPPELTEKVDTATLKDHIAGELAKRIHLDHARVSADNPGRARLIVDPVFFPNAQLATARYQIKSVTTKDGKDVLGENDDQKRDDDLDGTPALGFGEPANENNIAVSIAAVDPAMLDKATVELTVNVPTELAIFKFATATEQGRQKEQDDALVRLSKVDKNDVSVRFTVPKEVKKQYDSLELRPLLYGFDQTGGALASERMFGGGGIAGLSFKGLVQELWVVLPVKITEVNVTVDVALNGGERMQMPREPTGDLLVRYDRPEPAKYRSIEYSEFADQRVEWIRENQGLQWPGLYFLPDGSPPVEAKWEAHWFSKKAPVVLNGHERNELGVCHWNAFEGLDEAHAVIGRLGISMPTDLQTLVFEKEVDGQWLSQETDHSQTIKVRFDKQIVTQFLGSTIVLAIRATDETGRTLMINNTFSGTEDGDRTFFWGQPMRVELLIAHRTITKVIPFEIAQSDVDRAALAAYQDRISTIREVAAALEQTHKTIEQNWTGFDNIAGWYYLFNDEGKPQELIPVEIAHACQAGAERFGYEVKPYKGYYFAMMKYHHDYGERQPYNRFSKREYLWENGKVEMESLSKLPQLVAWSENPTWPTLIIVRWGQTGRVYMGKTGGKEVDTMPPNDKLNEKWQKLNFVSDPTVSP